MKGMKALKGVLRHATSETRFAALADLLGETPSRKLDAKVASALKSLPREEVRLALVEIIKRASEDDFFEIKTIYLKHFGDDLH
jgi:hypothetical protein